jgi:hypothetical protein
MSPRPRAPAWLLCAAFLAVSFAAQAQSRESGTVGIDVRATVSRPRAAIGSQVIVQVRIRGASDVGSVPFTLRYDPAILEFVGQAAAEGDFLRQGGASTLFIAASVVDESGATGEDPQRMAGVAVGLSRLGESGAAGSGTLCRLVFRARAAGTSPLAFERARVLSPGAAALPARFTGSAVEVREARR